MANRALNLVEYQEKAQFAVFREQLTQVLTENERLQESLEQVNYMLQREDQGWFRFGSGEMVMGLEILEIHQWSREIREAVAGNPHIKQGCRLRTNFVWQRGIRYDNIQGSKKGRGANIQARIDQDRNQRNFFGHAARERREAALYTDGTYAVLGDDRDYTLQEIPIWEIYGHYANPDDQSEVWAYLRKWNHYEAGKGSVPVQQWYLTDAHPDWDDPKKRPHLINYGGVNFPLDTHRTMFVGNVNGQTGWPYGVPDALSALVWARLYRDFMTSGKIMSDAMAQIAYQAASSTGAGQNNMAMKFAAAEGVGQTAVTGIADKLVPMSTAGKGYDFASGTALAAVIAAALEVSVVHLTANPGAGGSYGATATLDLPTQLAVLARRQWHIEFDTRILKWMGAKDPVVTFNSLETAADLFREVQALLLMWSSGLYAAEPIEKRLSELLDIIGNTVPDGVIIPNNSKADDLISTDRTAIPNPKPGEANGKAIAAAGQSPANGGNGNRGAGATGQGKTSPVGKGVNSNDLRTDKIANNWEGHPLHNILMELSGYLETTEREAA